MTSEASITFELLVTRANAIAKDIMQHHSTQTISPAKALKDIKFISSELNMGMSEYLNENNIPASERSAMLADYYTGSTKFQKADVISHSSLPLLTKVALGAYLNAFKESFAAEYDAKPDAVSAALSNQILSALNTSLGRQ